MRVEAVAYSRLLVAVLAAVAWSADGAAATEVPFTETFSTGSANWFNAAGTAALGWQPTGGPGDSAFALSDFNFSGSAAEDTPVLFRAQDEFGSSNGAFVGNWIGDGVTQFSAMVRHDAGVPLTYFTRFASPFNFPGATAINFIPVPSEVWTPITFAINPASPQFVSFEGTSFATVFGNVGHLQIGVSVPGSMAGLDRTINFGIDNASIVPEPATLVLLGIGSCTVLVRRARRRANP